MPEQIKYNCLVAPLQGLTTGAWRRVHRAMFPGATYVTPFLRIERGDVRQRDLNDLDPESDVEDTIPQVIANGPDEFSRLVDAALERGFNRVNLNAGCPHPPQISRHRGSALVCDADRLTAIASEMARYGDVTFSLKLRLGIDAADQWRESIEVINSMPIEWVAIHGRTARQMYKGDIDIEAMEQFAQACAHPVIYNGNINSVGRIRAVPADFAGVMAGRGVVTRPSLFHELSTDTKVDEQARVRDFVEMLNRLADVLSQRLQGDSQLLSHLLPYWQLMADTLPPRAVKEILKSRSMAKYNAALARFTTQLSHLGL